MNSKCEKTNILFNKTGLPDKTNHQKPYLYIVCIIQVSLAPVIKSQSEISISYLKIHQKMRKFQKIPKVGNPVGAF